MELAHAALYGVVEGITEFLPISSTAHLMLVREFLGIETSNFVKSFEIAIQLGAILAVVVPYHKKFLLDRGAMLRIAAALLPTLVLGALAYPFVKHLQDLVFIVPITLGIGGIVLLVFERFTRARSDREISTMPLRVAAAIGALQAFAFIPGISRSGATIVSAMALGMRKTDAVEFSFLLAAPTMLAATTFDLIKHYATFSSADLLSLSVGFAVSFFVAMATISFLVRFIASHSFAPFGVYRIIIGILLSIVFFL
jgi:undecaprenyl-diphosphatase